MAKYDSQLAELKNVLPTAKSILIAVPANANTDTLAASLALFLTLESLGKQVSIVCDDTIKVGQAHLFGVDHIQKNVPSTDGGNLTLTLEGVAASDNTIPALEKLDWYAQGNNLNLVFHVLPGQTFQPGKIVPHYQGGGFSVIFVVGAVNLTALGNVYNSNTQAFSGTHIVNIDTQIANTSFSQTNVLDTNASSVSEVMAQVLTDLGFALTSDIASNLLAGIFDVTSSLTNDKANAETFVTVANCLRVGGRKPANLPQVASVPQSQVQTTPSFDWSALMTKDSTPQPTVAVQPVSSVQPARNASQSDAGGPSDYTVPQVVQPAPAIQTQPVVDQGGDHQVLPQTPSGSPEERPAGEGVISETIEPEWLTPKIFKGSSIG